MINPVVIREVIGQNGDRFIIRETWDLKHPDCPFVVLDRTTNERNNVAFRLSQNIELAKDEIDQEMPGWR